MLPRERGIGLVAVAVVLAALSAYLWIAPPAMLVPPPLPEPTAQDVAAGLRMDLYTTALAIGRYQDQHGGLPPDLGALGRDVDPDVTYLTLGDHDYRLIGRRPGAEVRWDSGQPFTDLLGDAPFRVLREGSR